jgi:hypothetical protein
VEAPANIQGHLPAHLPLIIQQQQPLLLASLAERYCTVDTVMELHHSRHGWGNHIKTQLLMTGTAGGLCQCMAAPTNTKGSAAGQTDITPSHCSMRCSMRCSSSSSRTSSSAAAAVRCCTDLATHSTYFQPVPTAVVLTRSTHPGQHTLVR